ncbi:MAG TPA: N-acetyltransferase [Bacilli bacterium]|nr:N-acetyltransferase [Bacilli bacterium]
MMKIRLALPSDYDAIQTLTRTAFFDVYRPGCVEHVIVDKLRTDPIYVPQLEYVLELDGTIIGHIIYAVASIIKNDETTIDALIFGPISVDPRYQKQGYGAALIKHTSEVAKSLGYKFIAITGHPHYYGRFGFVPAKRHGLNYGDMDEAADQSFFMVKWLHEPNCIDIAGKFAEPSIYHVSDEELHSFEVKHGWR